MIRIVLFYLAMQLNGFLVSLYLKEYMTIEVLVLLQLTILGMAYLEIIYDKTIQEQTVTFKSRLRWLLLGFMFMLIVAIVISLLFPIQSRNQTVLVQVGKQIPNFNFLLFLVNASVLKEVVYLQSELS